MAHPHCDERVLCDHAQREKIISLQDYQMNEQETESKDYSDLYEAIFHLPEQIKLCVTLYYMEGVQCERGRRIVRYVTESAVKNRLAKSRGKLKKKRWQIET